MALVQGAYDIEPVWRTDFRNTPPTTPQQPQNLLRPTLMNGVGRIEPVWRTDFRNPPPTTPQQPQNLLRPTLMNGVSTGCLAGSRQNLVAGQYQGRLGNDLGGCKSCRGLGDVSVDMHGGMPSRLPDMSALKRRGQRYYQRGQALVDQGHTWTAEAMNTFAQVSDLDPSMVDWEGLASKGAVAALDWLRQRVDVAPTGDFVPSDIPMHTTSGYFQSILDRAVAAADHSMTPKQQAELVALSILEQQQKKRSLEIAAQHFSNTRKPGYPYVFRAKQTGKLIWTTSDGRKVLSQSPGFVFVRIEQPVAPMKAGVSLPHLVLGAATIAGLVYIGRIFF